MQGVERIILCPSTFILKNSAFVGWLSCLKLGFYFGGKSCLNFYFKLVKVVRGGSHGI